MSDEAAHPPHSPNGLRLGATSEGLPVAPSLGPSLAAAHVEPHATVIDRRVVAISALSVCVAIVSGLVAQLLGRTIALITNLSFHGQLSVEPISPMGHGLGFAVVLVPVAGALVIGVMARYGSKAIRGHGIPEAMEQILTNESKVHARLVVLKPLSAAISIGTGGPFGAEGPIIATGGALGSVLGQWIHVTANERKTLLAAGAAAGMTATFGSPISAVLLAVELLLFEYRSRSLIPVALATATAAVVRYAFVGGEPMFPVPNLAAAAGESMVLLTGIGALVGLASTFVTRLVYAIEDAFEHLPIHWMWWPALGAIVVGVVGYFAPKTLGVGYDNIVDLVSGSLPAQAILALSAAKLVSWSIALGSGTSGGTLAPLFTIGAGLGSTLGLAAAALVPGAALDPRMAALVGMAAMFAGASRALLASIVFAFETTRQPAALLPLLAGCTAAHLVSSLFMRHSIMTEKLARRGVVVPGH